MTRVTTYSFFILWGVSVAGCRTTGAGESSQAKDATQGGNPCSSLTDGFQSCGGSWGLDADKIFQCQRHTAIPVQRCSFGCQVQPEGVPDNCKSDPATPAAIQTLCDQPVKIINGAPEKRQRCGDSTNLFACDGKTAVLVQRCPDGCTSNPHMLWDLCAPSPSDPCADSQGGFTLACGKSSGGLNGDVLYSCYGEVSNAFQFCQSGCEVRPGGRDRCSDPCNEVAIRAVKDFSGNHLPQVEDIWTTAPGRFYNVSFGNAGSWFVNFPSGCSSTPTILQGSLPRAGN